MSLEKALGYLEKAGYREHVIQLGESTATVAMAAEALGVEPGRIAKTMSFLQGDKAVLIITEGTAKIDNRKYKDTFHVKAKMIPFEEVENIIGHAPGGVCPFGINAGIDVYLDESLKQFNIVYPAAGNDHSQHNSLLGQPASGCWPITTCRDTPGKRVLLWHAPAISMADGAAKAAHQRDSSPVTPSTCARCCVPTGG